jgi:hypothetical protein
VEEDWWLRHWGFVRRELEEHGISERCQLSPVPLWVGSRWSAMPVGAAHNGWLLPMRHQVPEQRSTGQGCPNSGQTGCKGIKSQSRQGIGIAGEQYNGIFRRLKGQHISGIHFQVFGEDEKLMIE